MNNSKDFVQSQFKKWKSAASSLILNEEGGTEHTMVELEPEYYEKCRQLAEAQNTTIASVVHYILEQQFAVRAGERLHQASAMQLEKNPLLALDGLTGRREKFEQRDTRDRSDSWHAREERKTEVEEDEFA
ncbi:hypothetical protein SAMN02799630_03467 [Paenibacillus sp. UNCCL117]|uniref:hypothetical protein n=1 Tax=unclassified Paenibacillus TaxID=185978 RepID=UPI00088E703C|nr:MULTISPECIES: hypothetical protein [unclassified Paenibacillus]SDD42723.1 hypothetical protein SAMN04488602_108152 [Paenibacillus sp. cl123]SFW47547.1 hypothetical protein SAMN02799630_03467 [Paenibacillus sp. UNCCL117]